MSFLFLVRVLTQKGLWQQLENSKSAWTGSGHDLARKVHQQAGETGGLADVGTFDLDSAREALRTGVTDWAVSDADAMHVFTMIRSADPEARSSPLPGGCSSFWGSIATAIRVGPRARIAGSAIAGWAHRADIRPYLCEPCQIVGRTPGLAARGSRLGDRQYVQRRDHGDLISADLGVDGMMFPFRQITSRFAATVPSPVAMTNSTQLLRPAGDRPES